MIKIIFLFLMVLTVYENSKALADDIERADEFIKFLDVYKSKVNSAVKKITKKKDSNEAQLKKLFARLTSNKVDFVAMVITIAIDTGDKAPSIQKYLNEVSITSQMNSTLKLIGDLFVDNVLYLGLLKAQKDIDEKKLKVKSIKKKTDKILRKEKTDDRLKDIYKTIMKSELFLDKIIESTKNLNEKELCGMQGSPQEVIYNFYIMCLSLELLTTTIMINGNAIYKIIDPDNGYEKKLDDHILQSKIRIKKYSSKFLSKLEQFPKNYRNCDPFDKDKHVRDVTYTEMSGLYQRILLFPYKMLNDDGCSSCEMINFTNGTDVKECYSNLSTSTPWDENGVPKELDKCTTPRNCLGTVSRCRALKKPDVCPFTDNPKRYRWLTDMDDEYNDKNQFGQRVLCGRPTIYFEEKTSPSGDLCQYCFCTCGDETPNSLAVNTVSLLPSLSDVAKNRVVIGARIIVQNNILHLQVREAKIDKNYKIAKDGPDRWIKIDDIQDAVRESRLESNMSKLNEFKDYIAWKENSTGFNFDEIPLDYGRVVTGLKFGMSEMEEDENINKIQIEVQSMEYNHETGQLTKDSEKWHRSNSKHPNFLKIGTRVSTMTKEKTIIDSNTDQWANLQVSHDRSDAGQTTVPLFDVQTVESINKGPFGGIGLHHRSSNDKFSGFFALTGYTIDYYQFLKETNKNLN